MIRFWLRALTAILHYYCQSPGHRCPEGAKKELEDATGKIKGLFQ